MDRFEDAAETTGKDYCSAVPHSNSSLLLHARCRETRIAFRLFQSRPKDDDGVLQSGRKEGSNGSQQPKVDVHGPPWTIC